MFFYSIILDKNANKTAKKLTFALVYAFDIDIKLIKVVLKYIQEIYKNELQNIKKLFPFTILTYKKNTEFLKPIIIYYFRIFKIIKWYFVSLSTKIQNARNV